MGPCVERWERRLRWRKKGQVSVTLPVVLCQSFGEADVLHTAFIQLGLGRNPKRERYCVGRSSATVKPLLLASK
jgi:hypothetical protein